MALNPYDSTSTIKVLNSTLSKVQDEIDATKESAIVTNRTVKSLDATVNGTIELDPYGQPIPVRDKSGETIYDDYGEPIFQRKGDGIVITKVKVDELDAKAITTDKLDAGDVKIKNAYIDTINGNKITNGSIIAKALSNDMVETLLGNNVIFSAEAPTERLDGTPLKDGDVWYKTLVDDGDENPFEDNIYEYRDGSWVEPYTGEISSIFRANSITAQEIVAHTITSEEIDTDYVYTNSIQSHQVYFGEDYTADDKMAQVSSDINDASKTATNFMKFDSSNGLVIGDQREASSGTSELRLKSDILGFYKPNSDNALAYFGNDDGAWALNIQRGAIKDDLRFGNFQWIARTNGNMSLKWID